MGSDRYERAFRASIVALVVVTIGANMPPPLFPRYVDAYSLSALQLTTIFATYTLLIAPALLVFGPLSDRVGRRPVLVIGLVAAATAATVLASAHDAWWLYAGRALQGVSVGAMQGSAAAALADTHPRGDVARAAVAGTIATCLASAIGPMTAGVLGEYFPAPLRLSFAVEAALAILAVPVLLSRRFPPGDRRATRPRPEDLRSTPDIRIGFARAAGSAVLAWVVTAIFLSLAPSILHASFGADNAIVSGGIVAVMLVTSALVQLASRSRCHVDAQVVGLGLLVCSLGMLVGSVAGGAVWLCVASAVLSGAGQGLAFGGSARAVGLLAPPARRGTVMSMLFVAIYLGVTVAIVGLGLLTTQLGLLAAVQVFSTGAAVACVFSIVSHVRAKARTR